MNRFELQWIFLPKMEITLAITVGLQADGCVVGLWDVNGEGELGFGDLIAEIPRYDRSPGRTSITGGILVSDDVVPYGLYRNASRLEVELTYQGKLYTFELAWENGERLPSVGRHEDWGRVV